MIKLGDKLDLKENIDQRLWKAKKSIKILRKLCHFIPRSALLKINKIFFRFHLGYGDIIYDQPSNVSFSDKNKSVQCNAALAIIGTTKGTLRVTSPEIRT